MVQRSLLVQFFVGRKVPTLIRAFKPFQCNSARRNLSLTYMYVESCTLDHVCFHALTQNLCSFYNVS